MESPLANRVYAVNQVHEAFHHYMKVRSSHVECLREFALATRYLSK